MGPLCVSLLLLTPFFSYAYHHQYSLFTVEIIFIFGLFISAGLCLGLLVGASGRFLQAFLLALLVSISLDLFSQDDSLAFLLGALLVGYFAIRILQRHVLSILSIMCLAAIVSNALIPQLNIYRYSELAEPGSSELPTIVHLILDEYMSVDALPIEVDGDGRLSQEMIDFFVQNGFDLAGGAYSQYFNTYNSIGNTLNFESSPVDASHFVNASEPYILQKSRYFESLAASGYRFRIYQSSYLDYCRVTAIPVVSCLTYESASIKYVEDAPLPPIQKASFILGAFGRISKLRVVVRKLYNRVQATDFANGILPFWKNSLTTYGPIPTLSLFDRIAGDISRSAGGEVFFAHLLIPHSAYILDNDCGILSDLEMWRSRKGASHFRSHVNSAESRIDNYKAYVKQLRCTNKLLAEFFDNLRCSDKYESTIIILHGDHGSRINLSWPTVSNLERLVASDFEDGFPTLFAAKVPNRRAEYSDTRKTLSALLAEVMGETSEEEGRVFLFNGKGKTMSAHAMPDSWLRKESRRAPRQNKRLSETGSDTLAMRPR